MSGVQQIDFDEQFDTRLKKGRGLGKTSLALIEAMVPIVEAAQPITGRGQFESKFGRKREQSATQIQYLLDLRNHRTGHHWNLFPEYRQ